MARISITDLPENQQVSSADLKQIVGGARGTGALMSASWSMQEMQMQQLEFQSWMSKMGPELTMMSNIMETKDGTAKNIINNVR